MKTAWTMLLGVFKLACLTLVQSLAFSVAVTVASTPAAEASVTRQIVNTVWNLYSPVGREVEIKNIDVVQYEAAYMSKVVSYYELDVYLWVRQDLGPQTEALELIDHLAPDQLTFQPIQKVGTDSANGYFVYKIRRPASKTFKNQFYASVSLSDRVHFSNEQYPDRFFEISGDYRN